MLNDAEHHQHQRDEDAASVLARPIALDQQVGVRRDHDGGHRVNGGDVAGRHRRSGAPGGADDQRAVLDRQLVRVGRDASRARRGSRPCDRGRRARRARPARRAAGKRTTNVQRSTAAGARSASRSPAPALGGAGALTRPFAGRPPRRRARRSRRARRPPSRKRVARQADAHLVGRATVDRQRARRRASDTVSPARSTQRRAAPRRRARGQRCSATSAREEVGRGRRASAK